MFVDEAAFSVMEAAKDANTLSMPLLVSLSNSSSPSPLGFLSTSVVWVRRTSIVRIGTSI